MFDRQNHCEQPRRSPWQKARDSAVAAKPVTECPYREGRWRSFWLREFEQAKQLSLPLAQ